MPFSIVRVKILATPFVAWHNRVRDFLSQFDPPPDAYPSTRLKVLRFFAAAGALFSIPGTVAMVQALMMSGDRRAQMFAHPLETLAVAIGLVTAIPVYLALRAHRRSGLVVYLIGWVAAIGRTVIEAVQTGSWFGVVWQLGVLAFLLSLWTELDQ